MNDFRFRQLEKYRTGGTRNKMQLSMPLPTTSSGKVYRYSPNENAIPRLFLLGRAPTERTLTEEDRVRIQLEPGSKQTVCPYSGYIANDEDFTHFDDLQAIKKALEWAVMTDVEEHFSNIFKDLGRQFSGNNYIQVKTTSKKTYRPKPAAIREDLLRNLCCNICHREYGVYAIALFCPDCGTPNLSLHFRREVELIRKQIDIADKQNEKAEAEIAYRLMGNAHEDVLTAFETTLKTVYKFFLRKRKPDEYEELELKIGNAFQNIGRGSEKFKLFDINPFSGLTSDELEFLTVNIQKRHVIGHNLGIADDRYVELDQDEQPGETVNLIGEEIKQFADICFKVIDSLEIHLLV